MAGDFHPTQEQWETLVRSAGKLDSLESQMRDGFKAVHHRIDSLKVEVAELRGDQAASREALAQIKGAKALALALLAVIGSVGTILGLFIGRNT